MNETQATDPAAPTKPAWSKTVPVAPGWYWAYRPIYGHPKLIQVFHHPKVDGDLQTMAFARYETPQSLSVITPTSWDQWYGPVEAPPTTPA